MTFNPSMLAIKVARSVEEAPNWRRDYCDVRAVGITEAIIVRNGTANGRATVDFVIHDEEGNQYVAMLTGSIVKHLAAAVEGAERS